MTHNPSTGEWYYSKTGWIEILRRLLYGLKSLTQEELSSSLRSAFAQYFLSEPDSKVICHEDNYSKLTFVEQLFTPFTVTKNGYLGLTVVQNGVIWHTLIRTQQTQFSLSILWGHLARFEPNSTNTIFSTNPMGSSSPP